MAELRVFSAVKEMSRLCADLAREHATMIKYQRQVSAAPSRLLVKFSRTKGSQLN